MLVDPVVEIGRYSSVELPVSVADIDAPHGSEPQDKRGPENSLQASLFSGSPGRTPFASLRASSPPDQCQLLRTAAPLDLCFPFRG
jgi:hypothetical protein